MSEAQKKANVKYEGKRQIKRVSFNLDENSAKNEIELFEFANSIDFSNWVKEKIKEELSIKLAK